MTTRNTCLWMIGCSAVLLLGSACLTDQTMLWRSSTEPACGNGVVEAAEACDDGSALNSNTAPDACREDCTLARCGDGVIDSDEGCDDGNTTSGDCCSAVCERETLETSCTDGVDNDCDGAVDCADTDCIDNPACPAVCGNGLLEAGEECDDGNSTNGDGCDARCMLE